MAMRSEFGRPGPSDQGRGPQDDTIRVAQADQNTASLGSGEGARIVVALELGPDGPVLRLPEGADISQPRLNGTDLEFVQPDGSVIVVPNGAVDGLVIVIGTVTIPAEAVAELLADAGIETAAGPDGTDGGHQFQDPGPGGIGDGIPYSPLLAGTDLGREQFTLPGIEAANNRPEFPSDIIVLHRVSEEGLAQGNADTIGDQDLTDVYTFTGTLGVTDFENHPLTFVLTPPTTAMTSGGFPLIWDSVADNQLIGTANGVEIIRIVVDNGPPFSGGGNYTVSLSGPLDHTGAGEDEITFEMPIKVTDLLGAFNTATLSLTIEDDSPVVAGGSASVDEDGLTGASTGIGDDADGDDDAGADLLADDGNEATATGSLGISWGADRYDTGTDEIVDLDPTSGELLSVIQDHPDGLGDRSVVFASDDIVFSGVETLTSKGSALEYVLNADGTILTAYALDEVGEGQTVSRPVFQVALSDEATGYFRFILFDQLDHLSGDAENNLSLSFSFTATDSDGDAVSGSFTVDVDDDLPARSEKTPPAYKVDEDDIKTLLSHGTSPNDGNGDGSYTGSSGSNGPGPATVSGTVYNAVEVGADEPLRFIFTETGNDVLSALGLTSKGQGLSYTVTTGQITAYVDNTPDLPPGPEKPIPTFGWTGGGPAVDRVVFTLTLDPDSGDFVFSLYDQLDHDRPRYGADQNFDLQDAVVDGDVRSLDFGGLIAAVDYDGDFVTLDGHLTIKIRDDVPELTGKHETGIVDEDDIDTSQSHGTSADDGAWKDGSYTGEHWPENGDNPNYYEGPATIDGSLRHLVDAGADEKLTFSFQYDAVRSMRALGLSSDGRELSYEVRDGVLYGFVNAHGIGEHYDLGPDRLVFKLSLETDGDYEFELFDQLDHDKPYDDKNDGEGIADQNYDLRDGLRHGDVTWLDFGKVIKATDYDGDSVDLDGAFKIKVRDDVPELAYRQYENRTIDEDDINTFNPRSRSEPGSQGTSPNDGSEGDGSETGNPPSNDKGPAYIDGSLAHLVRAGADEDLTFRFIDADDVRSALRALGLKSQGHSLSYEIKDGVVIGFDQDGNSEGERYDPRDGDRLVFKLTLEKDGDYEFELFDQLDHDKPYDDDGDVPSETSPNADENTDLEDRSHKFDVNEINFGKLIKATDADGDSVILDGRFTIKVTDDIPTLGKLALSGRDVQHDETAKLQTTGGDDDVAFTTLPNDIKAAFNGVAEKGVDLDVADKDNNAIGYARSGGSLVSFTYQIGADGPGKVSYALSLGEDGIDSGLKTTEGYTIRLYLEDGVIVGRYELPEEVPSLLVAAVPEEELDPAAFAIVIDDETGQVYLAQYVSLEHPTKATEGNNYVSYDEAIAFAAGKVFVAVKVADYDGDFVRQTIDVGGKISFADDGPSVASNDELFLDDETATTTYDTPNLGGTDDYADASATGGTLAHTYGSDGAGSTLFSGVSGLGSAETSAEGSFYYTLSEDGLTLTITQIQEEEAVDVLKLTLTEATSGSYAIEQLNPVFHPTEGESEESQDFLVTYRVTDGDGDTADGSVTIDIDDDTPELVATKPPKPPVLEEPDGDAGGDQLAGMGLIKVWTDYENQTGEMPAEIWGISDDVSADRIGLSVRFANGLEGTVTYSSVAGLWNQQGFQAIAFDSASGFFTAAGGLHFLTNDGFVLPLAWAGFVMPFSDNFDLDYTDTIGSHFRANIGGWTSAEFKTYSSAVSPVSPTASIDLSQLVRFGADGPQADGAFALSSFDPVALAGIFSNNVQVMIESDGDTLTGKSGDKIVFTLKIVDGEAVLTMSGPLDNNESPALLDFSAYISATDGDGDSVALREGMVHFLVSDGTNPSVVESAEIEVDEDGLENGNATGSGDAGMGDSGTVTFKAGSDNIVDVAFGGLGGLTVEVNGDSTDDIEWRFETPTQIVGAIGGIDAIQIGLIIPPLPITTGNTGDATVEVTILDNFPHPDGNAENTITIGGLTVVATDADGDTTSADVGVTIVDDVPQAFDDEVTIEEDSSAFSGNVLDNDVQGADSAKLSHVRFAGDDNFVAITTGAHPEGGTTFTFDRPEGTYTFEEDGDWTFTPAENFNGETGFAYQIIDGDGDLSDPPVGFNVAITVTPVNDPPANTVPGTQTTNEDTAKVFNAANGNLISISDVDGSTAKVTLTATNGTITLSGVVGLTFEPGADGTNDATMTFTGTMADINTALNGLSFQPAANFNGAASLSIKTDDLGNTGTGGALSDTDTIDITVNAVNDAPTTTDILIAINEGETASWHLSASDVEGDVLTYQLVDGPDHGTLTFNPDGTYTYEHDGSASTEDSFTFKVSDPSGAFDAGTANIEIAPTEGTLTFITDIDDRDIVSRTTGGSVSPGPEVTKLVGGGHLVVWSAYSTTADNSGYGVFMQRYDAAGERVGGETRVNTTTTNDQAAPSVAPLPDGGWVVVWQGNGAGDGYGIFGQRYDNTGSAVGGEFPINVTTISEQNDPEVATLSDGNIAVTWSNYTNTSPNYTDVLVRIFSVPVSGAPTALTGEFAAHTTAANYQYTQGWVAENIEALSGGRFVVIWQEDNGGDTYARIYDNDGTSFLGPFQVNALTTEGYVASVGALNDGGFVVTWFGYNPPGGSGYDIVAARYNASGAKVQEFRVNSLTYSDQYYSKVQGLSDGGFAIVWQSYNGNDYDIHGQRYDAAGAPVGQEFLVNGRETFGYSFGHDEFPSLAVRNDGALVVAWRDSNGGIIEQRIIPVDELADLEVFNDNTIVSQTTGGSSIYPEVTKLADGGHLVVWSAYSTTADNSGYGVFMQRYDAAGERVGTETRVNTTVTGDQIYSSVTQLPDGGWVVIWQGNGPGGLYEIVGQRYNSLGNPVGGEFVVNDTPTGSDYEASIATLSNGDIAVTWRSYNGSNYDVLMRVFDLPASVAPVAITGELMVHTSSAGYQYTDGTFTESIEALSGGRFVVVWRDDSSNDTYARIFNDDGSGFFGPFQVNALTSEGYYASVGALTGGGFVVTWYAPGSAGGSGYDIIAARYDAAGAKLSEFRVNTLIGDNQYYPKVQGLADGGFVVVWQSPDYNWDIHGQRYDSAGAPVGSEFLVSVDESFGYYYGSDQTPSLAVRSDGALVVAWTDYSNQAVIQQRIIPVAELAELEIGADNREIVSQTTGGSVYHGAEVTKLADGGHLVVWSPYYAGSDNSSYGVYMQRYDAAGERMGLETRVNTTTANDQIYPSVAPLPLPDGGWVVVWQGNGPGDSYGIFGQRYDSSGNPVGGEFLINATTASSEYEPTIATLSNGDIVVTWMTDNGSTNYDVFARIFDVPVSGAPTAAGAEFMVHPVSSNYQYTEGWQAETIEALNGGRFVVVWRDDTGTDIYARIFDNNGTSYLGPFQVNALTSFGTTASVGALNDGGFIVTWMASGSPGGSNYDIIAARYDATGAKVGEFRVNTLTYDDQYYPKVQGLNDGGFVVVWQSPDGNWNIHGQRYDADGDPVGGEFLVSGDEVFGYAFGNDELPSLAVRNDGAMVVAWRDGNANVIEQRIIAMSEWSDGANEPKDLTGGAGNDVLHGGTAGDTLAGAGGEDLIRGEGGDDSVSGGAGDDTIVYDAGDGVDTVDGGEGGETAGDALVITTSTDPDYVAISPDLDADAHLDIDIDLNSSTPVADPIELDVVDVEEIVVNTQGGDDTVVISGDLSGTGVAQNTIRVDLGGGADTIDTSGLESAHRVLVEGGQGADKAVLGFDYADGEYEEIRGAGNVLIGVKITHTVGGEEVTDEYRNVESFQFTDDTLTLGEIFNSPPTTDDAVASGNEDTIITVSLVGADIDGNHEGFAIVSVPANGTLHRVPAANDPPITAGEFLHGTVGAASPWQLYFKPDANWSGETTFDYAARDRLGLQDATPAAATITVAAVNDAPVVTGPVAATATEGGSAVVINPLANASDPEGSSTRVVGIPGSLPAGVTFIGGAQPIAVTDFAGLSIPVGSNDAPSYPSLSGVWGQVAPINVTLGIGQLINPAPISISNFTLHDHVYLSPFVPNPGRAVVTFQFAQPTVITEIDVIEHANGISKIHGYAGNSLGALVDVGSTYGSLGDPASFTEGAQNSFSFANNTVAGTFFRFVIEETSFPTGYAFYRAFPEAFANGQFQLDPTNGAYDYLAEGQQLTVTVNYEVSDGSLSTPASVSWTITGVNDAPVLSQLSSSVTFLENTVNATAQIIDSAVSLTDADSADFTGGNLRITYSSGGASEDQLSFLNQGSGAGQVGVSGTTVGSTISYGGVAIGTIGSSGTNGSDLVVNFNASATATAVDALIQRLAYANTSDAPNGSRTISITVNDGDGNASIAQTTVIAVTAENDAPIALDSAMYVGTNWSGSSGDFVSAIDPDSSVTYALIENLHGSAFGPISFSSSSGLFTWGIGASAAGTTDYFRFSVSDGVLSDTGQVNFFRLASATVYALTGTSGNDEFMLPFAAGSVHAGAGDDQIRAPGGGAIELWGDDGSDWISGLGSLGSLKIHGGNGLDFLQAGSTPDTYIWEETISSANVDTILTYKFADGDKLDFQAVIPVIAGGQTAGNYVQIVQVGSDLQVMVDIDGTGSTAAGLAYILSNAGTSGVDTVRLQFGSANYTITDTGVVTSVADPIVLDLDGDGIRLDGVVPFDLDHDGAPDTIGWPGARDGLLVADLDDSGKIESGNEVFSPSFGQGGHADSIAALRTFDSNADGRIDEDDVDFGRLKVWTDANGNGASDDGELHGLADLGIVGIGLDAAEVDYDVDGQRVFAEGHFELANGETRSYLGVELGAPALAHDAAQTGGPAQGIYAGQEGTGGADVFVLDNIDASDLIADYDFVEGDEVDVSGLFGPVAAEDVDTPAELANYVKYEGDTLKVDIDGAGTAHDFKDVAVINQPTTQISLILDDGVEVTINQI